MSWTDANLVKLHLQAFSVDALTVRLCPTILEGTDSTQLPHNTLSEGTLTIHQSLASGIAGPVSVTLTGTSWFATGYDAASPDSIVVSPTDPPLTRYIEGVDYAVDDVTAKIKRLDVGSITSGDTVQLWLIPLTLMDEDVDYSVNYASGTIARVVTGDLPDPARVYVSYSTSAAGATDALIGQVIQEAETKILERLREGYDESSTEDALTIGATELTVSTLCDDLALRSLTAVGDASADDRAKRFMELAVRYHERAISTLSRFLKQPLPSPVTLKPGSPPPVW